MRLFLSVSVCLLFATSGVSAQELKVETVIDGLYNPCGIAIQPGTGDLFVSESGALRVVRIVDDKAVEVITGFPKDQYGTGAKYGSGKRYTIGPLGLAFFDQSTLIVGGGGKPYGQDILRIYKVPDEGAEAIVSDKMEGDAQVLAADEDKNIPGEGNFFGVSIFKESVYATCNGDDTKGWIAKADIAEGKLSNISRTIETKAKTMVSAPIAITKSPEGYIVVGFMGSTTKPSDSLIAFFDTSGEELADWKYETDLNDISAIAYGPKRGRLFATDFNWLDPKSGGLYKIVAGDKPGTCKSVKLQDLDKPTAMVFDEEGNLFVALMGTEKDNKPNGSVVMISGLDAEPKKDD